LRRRQTRRPARARTAVIDCDIHNSLAGGIARQDRLGGLIHEYERITA
jgi:hypothetical protein